MRFVRLFAAVAVLAGTTAAAQDMNTLTAQEKAAGWKLLFDGKTLEGWRPYKETSMDSSRWMVKDGTLTKTGTAKDIVTKEKFTDFELSLEWRLGARRGNAGIFYRATEDTNKVYWTAPEYQLGTDSTPDTRYADRAGTRYLRAPGAVYDFHPSIPGAWKNENEWNSTRIVVKGTHVEHWLNGQKIAEFDYWSPDFTEKFNRSKFASYPTFAKATTGFIAIQGDHAGELNLRNVKIREIR